MAGGAVSTGSSSANSVSEYSTPATSAVPTPDPSLKSGPSKETFEPRRSLRSSAAPSISSAMDIEKAAGRSIYSLNPTGKRKRVVADSEDEDDDDLDMEEGTFNKDLAKAISLSKAEMEKVKNATAFDAGVGSSSSAAATGMAGKAPASKRASAKDAFYVESSEEDPAGPSESDDFDLGSDDDEPARRASNGRTKTATATKRKWKFVDQKGKGKAVYTGETVGKANGKAVNIAIPVTIAAPKATKILNVVADSDEETDDPMLGQSGYVSDSSSLSLYDSDQNSDSDSSSDDDFTPQQPPTGQQPSTGQQPPTVQRSVRATYISRRQQQAAEQFSKKLQNERERLEKHHPILNTMWDELDAMPKIEGEIEQPEAIKRQLKPFQRKGVHWMMQMERGKWKGGLLGDEMGLGKTIQAVTLIMSDYPAPKPSLVLVPPVAMIQWADEIKSYTDGKLKTCVWHGSFSKTKNMTIKDLKKFDVIIMSYNSLESMYRKQVKGFTRKDGTVKEGSLMHKMAFHRIILDEAHNIKVGEHPEEWSVRLADIALGSNNHDCQGLLRSQGRLSVVPHRNSASEPHWRTFLPAPVPQHHPLYIVLVQAVSLRPNQLGP